ncbi:MAG TPA: hypothetical protein VGK35_14730 [Actinotalea sp.]
MTTRAPKPQTVPAPQADGAPVSLRVGVAVILVEAAALVAGAVWGLVVLVTGQALDVAILVSLVVCALLLALVLAGTAGALVRGRRGARAPALAWQVLQGATALAILQAGAGGTTRWAAVVVLTAAAVGAVLVLTPAATRYITGSPARDAGA